MVKEKRKRIFFSSADMVGGGKCGARRKAVAGLAGS